jgi:hypothetical protein
MVEGEYPDYLQVYQTCLNGEQVAASAKQLAESVPGSRKSNEANIGRLNTGVTNLKMRYNDALVAGVSLEPYAPYRILDQVELANKQLDSALTQIRSAQDQNSMRVQQFLGAAELLGTVDRQLSATDLLFNNAVQKWETVSAAKAQIPGAKASASTAIASAISHKNSYSENSQSTAESYISQAQSAMRSGNSYATVDPPKGLSYYHQAKNYADQAYSAVDTSDNDYHSSSSSSDWSGSSGGGSTSTWGGSTGSGSSSSNWGGSSGGGNYGGPSGGGYGGPSGGGMGRGGF